MPNRNNLGIAKHRVAAINMELAISNKCELFIKDTLVKSANVNLNTELKKLMNILLAP